MTRRVRLGAALAAVFAAVLAQASPAAPVDWQILPEMTRVHFEVLHFGTATVRGRFDRLDGSVTLDREAGRGEVSIVVETVSVSTGVRPFDGTLRGSDLLDAAAHPQAWFVARRIEFDGRAPQRVHGELTLRGISRPLVLQATRFGCAQRPPPVGEVCGGDFTATLRRSAFGITFGLPFIADEVRLVVQVEARPR